jgi:hypothetical protein
MIGLVVLLLSSWDATGTDKSGRAHISKLDATELNRSGSSHTLRTAAAAVGREE